MDKKRIGADQEVKVYEYELPGGWKVLAGKTDEDNDLLSLRLAHPRTGGSTCAACRAAMCFSGKGRMKNRTMKP